MQIARRGGNLPSRSPHRPQRPSAGETSLRVPRLPDAPAGGPRGEAAARPLRPVQREASVWKLTAEQKAEAVERYAAGQGSPEIAAAFGVSNVAILGVLRRRGVVIRGQREAQTKHTLRHDALDVLTADAAYWCGFLFTDGTIMPRRAGKGAAGIAVALSDRDRGHLEKFRTFLGPTHAITPIAAHRPMRATRRGPAPPLRGQLGPLGRQVARPRPLRRPAGAMNWRPRAETAGAVSQTAAPGSLGSCTRTGKPHAAGSRLTRAWLMRPAVHRSFHRGRGITAATQTVP